MGKAVFRVSARAAAPKANKMASAAGRIRQTAIAEFRGELSNEIESIFRAEAPHGESGRTAESVKAAVSFGGGGVQIQVKADPVSDAGYHYLDVTRRGRGPAAPRRGRAIFWKGADHPVARVGAYTPAGDWVDRADAASEPVVAAASDRIGRVIATRVL